MVTTIKLCIWAGPLAVATCLYSPAEAQNHWMHPIDGPGVTVEVYRPQFYRNEYFGTFNLSWIATGRFQVARPLTIVVDIPFAHFHLGGELPNYYFSGPESEFTTGNPYLGLELATKLHATKSTGIVRLGVRLPLAENDKSWADITGTYSTLGGSECFFTEVVTASLGFGLLSRLDSGLKLEANVDGSLMIPTEKYYYPYSAIRTDKELYLNYGLELWQAIHRLQLGMGINGRLLTTQSGESLGELSDHELGLAATCDIGSFRPGIHFGRPLDEYRSRTIDYVIGVSVSYQLKQWTESAGF